MSSSGNDESCTDGDKFDECDDSNNNDPKCSDHSFGNPDTDDSDTNSRVIIMKSDDVVESVKPEDTESEESSPSKSPEKIIHIQTG